MTIEKYKKKYLMKLNILMNMEMNIGRQGN